jgi:Dual specificity phosphatase, catalytic domain
MSQNPLPDISKITEFLFISAWPRGEHVEGLRSMEIRLILSMDWRRPSKLLAANPIHLLWIPTIDSPLIPMPISFLRRGVEAAMPVIEKGYRVLTHCRFGIHRSVAMACCVLIGAGYNSGEAIRLVKSRRPVADPDIWYIRSRILKFEREWKTG